MVSSEGYYIEDGEKLDEWHDVFEEVEAGYIFNADGSGIYFYYDEEHPNAQSDQQVTDKLRHRKVKVTTRSQSSELYRVEVQMTWSLSGTTITMYNYYTEGTDKVEFEIESLTSTDLVFTYYNEGDYYGTDYQEWERITYKRQ